MSKRKRKTTKRPSRSGSPWPRGASSLAEAPELGVVERETLTVLLAMRAELAREPSPDELAARLGLRLRDVTPRLEALARLGLPAKLTGGQERCLIAIAALEARLGRSPSTREVSDEMGIAPSGSRFHINGLVRLGLVTKPRVVLVLSVTPIGRAFLPAST
jgi:hypothetical protein